MVTKEERNQLLSQFQSWDKDNNGVLSRSEIYDGYSNLFGEIQAKEQIDFLMQGIDMNGDGEINYNEFLAFAMNRQKLLSKTNLESAFKTFDKVNRTINSSGW